MSARHRAGRADDALWTTTGAFEEAFASGDVAAIDAAWKAVQQAAVAYADAVTPGPLSASLVGKRVRVHLRGRDVPPSAVGIVRACNPREGLVLDAEVPFYGRAELRIPASSVALVDVLERRA